MKTIKQVTITPIFTEFIPSRKDMKQGELYISEKYETASHLCLCGCKNLVVTPLYQPGGWVLKKENTTISLSPSIGNFQIDCRTHYIITKNIANFV